MGSRIPSEQSSLPYNSTFRSRDTEQDYSVYQSQGDFYPGNLRSDGTEVSPITPGPYSYPHYQYGTWNGKAIIEATL